MTDEEKKCPLRPYKEGGAIVFDPCLENECALWEQFTGTCSLATAAFLAGREMAAKEGWHS